MSEPPSEEAIDPSFVKAIPGIIGALAPAVADVPEVGRQWVFYGSMPTGSNATGSDLDILLLHDDHDVPPHRRSARWSSIPATVYVLSHDDLADDGRRRRFGGYFSLKLFSPFVSDLPANDHTLARSSAEFLGPLSAMAKRSSRNSWSSEQLLAHSYLAFMEIYPDFAGYLARLARDRDRFALVWRYQLNVHVPALRDIGCVERRADDDRWAYTGSDPIVDVERERARCAARFWAFGAVCHGADPEFPDFYFRKTESHASFREQRSVIEFLNGVSNGSVAV